MNAETIQVLITALLGGGLVTTVGALARGWRSLRQGARAREREGVADLARWRDEADEARRVAERDRDYWRWVAGRYGYQLFRAGVDPVPADPVPPSERGERANA